MPTYNIIRKLAKVLEFDIYQIDDMNILDIPKPDKIYLKALSILNSAKNDDEKNIILKHCNMLKKAYD